MPSDSPRSWSSRDSVGGFGAASIAGFDPVGQVFGTIVAYPRPVAFDRCFVTGPSARSARSTADPYNPLLARLNTARRVALERAVAECRALGGDGIVGARYTCTNFFTHSLEFTIEGTAMRARSLTRPETPFTTHVCGQDLAKLLSAGWMPFALVFGTAIAAGHFDNAMFQQTTRGIGAAGNREVSGYTRLVNDARRQARRELEAAVRERGGDGAVVQDIALHVSERECPSTEERFDYMVEAVIVGSAIASFERSEQTVHRPPLAIMRLDRGSAAAAEPESARGAAAGPSLGDRAFAYLTARRDAQATDVGEPPAES